MAKKPAAGDVLVATRTGFVSFEGVPHRVRKGITRVRVGHPIFDAAPDWFGPIDNQIHYDVEQATAEPGEKRGTATTEAPEITGKVEKVVEEATAKPGAKRGGKDKS